MMSNNNNDEIREILENHGIFLSNSQLQEEPAIEDESSNSYIIELKGSFWVKKED